MSRRKQQNPKSVKYEGDENEAPRSATLSSPPTPSSSPKSNIHEDTSSEPPETPGESPELLTEVKVERESPILAVSSPTRVSESSQSPPPELNLEAMLGVPENAPLRVERCDAADGFRILSSTSIPKGAGLDPLRAQQLLKVEEDGLENPQVVSFRHKSKKVFFKLDAKVNCGWMKYLGAPSEQEEANLRIYFVGGQLWVEVIKTLQVGEQLIAEFFDPTSDMPQPGKATDSELKVQVEPATSSQDGNSFPCHLCGISFRNPNTLAAHRKHYCSKAAKNSATVSAPAPSPPTEPDTTALPTLPNPRQAYICSSCQHMTLSQGDMERHLQEQHKVTVEAREATSTIGADKTYCDDCEIAFKKPESYQAHRLHYCKKRSESASPKSGSSHSPNISQGLPALPAKDLYNTVSIMDSQTAIATAAAAAAMAAATGLAMPGLPNVLGLPGMAGLSGFQMNLLQSPAIIAQAMENAAKAVGLGVSTHSDPPQPARRQTETPLDLTKKHEMDALSATKRSSEPSDNEISPPAKRSARTTSDETRVPRLPAALLPGLPKKAEAVNRPIYRCELCSIPFYKKDVYEAHKQHYCSGRSSNSSEPPAQQDEGSDDDRLVITYTCNKCSTSYRTRESFKAHQCATEEKSPPAPLGCDECGFQAASRSQLLDHQEVHAKVNVTFKCKLCGYHGNTMRGMRQHGRQHLTSGEVFSDSDVVPIPHSPTTTPRPIGAPAAFNDVDDQLLRMKNEPYKKRRSRKHYQKTEHFSNSTDSSSQLSQSPRERKENGGLQQMVASPDSSRSSHSPLQIAPGHIPNVDRPTERPSPPALIKQEPTAHGESISPSANKLNPRKNHICSCKASFAFAATYEAHKKHYCPHNKLVPNGSAVTASS